MRVLTVVGNRPQFIKSAPLSLALRDRGIEEIVLHTGQHYDRLLSTVFFQELGLAQPRYSLDLRTAQPEPMRVGIADAVEREGPEWVLVFGDTNSTLAGSLAALETGVAHAHVEAGLRSGDLSMPEERNRVAVDRAADLLFAPDERSAQTLRDEGVHGRIEVVGDVMADASRELAPIALARSQILTELGLEPGRYAVATVHREANVQAPRLAHIIAGLNALAEPVVFPAHPRTRAALARAELTPSAQLRLIEPLGYLDLAALAAQARVIVTDSGGLQKEAYWYGVPCVTLRLTTEWPDTVEAGANVLVGDDPERIAAAVARARMPAARPKLYGDGHASERIAETLVTLNP